jgi:hypothetical protein
VVYEPPDAGRRKPEAGNLLERAVSIIFREVATFLK